MMTYGEKYIADYGMAAAVKRVEYLKNRAAEEIKRRCLRTADNLIDEYDNIEKAIWRKENPA